MNKKGFTLVELLAVLVVLGIVIGITIPSINGVINKSKAKSEESFIETIKDAMDIYMSSAAKSVTTYSSDGCDAGYEKATITFQDVIDSPYKPINQSSLMNSGSDLFCTGWNHQKTVVDPNTGKNIIINLIDTPITLYRNTNTYVYYYLINKSGFYGVDELIDLDTEVLKKGTASKSCFKYTNSQLYISNLKDPGNPPC